MYDLKAAKKCVRYKTPIRAEKSAPGVHPRRMSWPNYLPDPGPDRDPDDGGGGRGGGGGRW